MGYLKELLNTAGVIVVVIVMWRVLGPKYTYRDLNEIKRYLLNETTILLLIIAMLLFISGPLIEKIIRFLKKRRSR